MASQRHIHDVAASEGRRLRSDPNIKMVGYGVKHVGGKVQYQLCLQYYVRRKMTSAEATAAGSWPIPSQVEGYPTDVVVHADDYPAKDYGPATGERGSRREDPLLGGTSTTSIGGFTSFPGGYGTLGGLCFDNSNGNIGAISNAHVWGTDVGRDVIQPWLSIGEYLEAGLKLALCGPLAYPLEGTWPSGLTVTLAAASAAAFVAAAASDAEDPTRFGQRSTPVADGVRTLREEVNITTNQPPDRPFAGRAYAPNVTWNYVRHLADSTLSATSTENRPNIHYLTGKRAWSNAKTYTRGQTVDICARVVPSDLAQHKHFVVANIFPLSDPSRVVRRVLRLGSCSSPPPSDRICFDGFPSPAAPGGAVTFPFAVGDVQLDADTSSVFESGGTGSGVALRIPSGEFRLFVPSSTRIDLSVIGVDAGANVSCRAISAADRVVASRTSDATRPGQVQILSLPGDEIVEVLINATGHNLLTGVCHSAGSYDSYPAPISYTGSFNLATEDPTGTWGVVLMAQSVDDTPLEVAMQDPVIAARRLGGIVESSNVAELAGCAVVMLLDHTFQVF